MILYFFIKIWLLIVKFYWIIFIMKVINYKENVNMFIEYVNRVFNIVGKGSNRKLRK